MKTIDVIAEEKKRLLRRRERLNQSHGETGRENWFGIALSGGGIRSATINLGFLRTLSRFGILKKADYLSTVSGGGYTHAYIQGTLKAEGAYEKLFTDQHAEAFRQHGEYMTPGTGFGKNRNLMLLIVAFLVSWIMSLVSLIIVGGIAYFAYECFANLTGAVSFDELLGVDNYNRIAPWYLYTLGILLAVHFAFNVLFTFSLDLSKKFNQAELALTVLGLGLLSWRFLLGWKIGEAELDWWQSLLCIVGLIALGLAANPNGLSFHRFYRKQLADLFLRFSGAYKNVALKDLFDVESKREADYLAPYPLINTCLNLQNPAGDQQFKGVKASDYFLFSPLFCGSKLTDYAPIDQFRDFRNMTLPAAVTASAAAVNPGMGVYSSKVRSALLSLLNARLGFWVSNPRVRANAKLPVWWPFYFLYELLGRIGTDKQMVNVSDGGHIENLGVYELLRRGCRLVIAVDAGEDHAYTFVDLNNLLLRARNELGLEIEFEPGKRPEDLILPRPSQVYSTHRFAIGKIKQHWVADPVKVDVPPPGPNEKFPRTIGTFVYVKSSVTPPSYPPPESSGFKNKAEYELMRDTYYYKIYHPEFPHESTADQFFDRVQWEAYYRLGQYLGADILGLDDLGKAERDYRKDVSVETLVAWFDDWGNPTKHPFDPAEKARIEDAREGRESLKGSYGQGGEGRARSAEPPPAAEVRAEECRI